MTALAQHRAAHGQHAWMVGAVWVVTIAAVFSDRRVLPKIRSAFLGMAIEAGIVQRLLGKLQVTGRTMCAVAAAAIHFSLAYRMRIGLQRLSSLLLVAIEANFRLC